jgi:hypothetical protein
MPINPKTQQHVQQIGQSGQQAASALLQGGQQIGQAASNMQKSIPGAKQNFYTQAGNAIGAGQAQSGRGGASAYGGALQGGLQASQQAANFEISSGQALADMYAQQANMTSEGYATQAATAGQMLGFEGMQQADLLAAQKQISDIEEEFSGTFYDDIDGMSLAFDRLISVYQDSDNANMVIYMQGQKKKMINHYSGFDGSPTVENEGGGF